MGGMMLQPNEQLFFNTMSDKKKAVQQFLRVNDYKTDASIQEQFRFWSELKRILGNFHNDISFLASMQAKSFLEERFGEIAEDMGSKAQGAPGLDIDITLHDGRRIIAEIKTTVPYAPGFGAQQKTMIKKDLDKLRAADADYKFMMVTDEEAFNTLCSPAFVEKLKDIELVSLWSGRTHRAHMAII